MMKPHCDNCDVYITESFPQRRNVTVQPGGYQCAVSVAVDKVKGTATPESQHLCRVCLREAVNEWLRQLP